MIPAKYRKFIYAATVAVMSFVFVAGIVTPEQVTVAVEQATQVVSALVALLALLNVSDV